MLPTNIANQLRELGIEAAHSQDFVSGLRLMQLVTKVFYGGDTQVLSSKLRLSEDHKTGNNVLNINTILNHIKKDQNIQMEDDIRELSAFKILEDDTAMIQLIEWVLTKREGKPAKAVANMEMSPPREDENQFDNLYFVSSIEKKTQALVGEAIVNDDPGERVVRKGSFKVLRPKVRSDSKQSVKEESIKQENLNNETKNQSQNSIKEPLRELVVINANVDLNSDDRDDLNCRKTVPKMYDRPPLYRSKLKEQKTEVREQKKETPLATTRPADKQGMIHDIQSINRQIAEEQQSLIGLRSEEKTQKSRKTSARKIFKLDIAKTEESRKKVLLEWLIGINLLGSNSTKHLNDFQDICKDGVLFMEILNYYRGRGRDICFFKEPKRSAELHSNYQKLYSALHQIAEFNSELLFKYEYFIPEAQPNAFWSLLSSMHSCFFRQNRQKDSKVMRYDDTIRNKLNTDISGRKKLNESVSYNSIKFNSNSLSKEVRSNFSSIQIPRKETPKPVVSRDKHSSKSRNSSREKELQIVESKAIYGLIQNEEPADEHLATERGYKQMYLCKFKNVNIQTPHKSRSLINTSLSRSRLRASQGSSKKKEARPAIPSISLEMQMIVLRYLKGLACEQQSLELFKDPYRNGVLLCQIVKKQLGIDCFVSKKPSNIEDCRNNFLSCIGTIKTKHKNLNCNYELYIQELIKGEKSLLYGLIWPLIKEQESIEPLSHVPRRVQLQQRNEKDNFEELVIFWIRSIEKYCPEIASLKIRNQQALFVSILNTDFLFQYSWFITGKRAITPAYDHPSNNVQRQSNLKKALGYLVQSKIIRSDYLWKTKSIVNRQNHILNDLVIDLMTHYNHLNKKEQIKSVNFVKYLKRDDEESKEKKMDRLETTMANQSHHNTQLAPEVPRVEINWMRKLGFNSALELNNGVILCRLISRLTMKTIEGVNENPQSRAESLGNIRRAIKEIPKFKWDEYDILEADYAINLQIYAFLRQKYKHAYAMKFI